jgi:transposase
MSNDAHVPVPFLSRGYPKSHACSLTNTWTSCVSRSSLILMIDQKAALEKRKDQSHMGHRITRVASHLSVDEVKERMKRETRAFVRQRRWIIYNVLVAPREAQEISLHTGVSVTTVHRVIATYNRLGPGALETSGKGGRRYQYLTLQKEQAFLAPFFKQAECGEIATVAQIQHALEEQVGHEVDNSTIYRLLKRHGWRKLMPRPRHPKTDPQIQEQFKKNFQRRWKQQLQREKRETSAPS